MIITMPLIADCSGHWVSIDQWPGAISRKSPLHAAQLIIPMRIRNMTMRIINQRDLSLHISSNNQSTHNTNVSLKNLPCLLERLLHWEFTQITFRAVQSLYKKLKWLVKMSFEVAFPNVVGNMKTPNWQPEFVVSTALLIIRKSPP